MTPFYADDWLTVYGGDCLEVMRTMPSDSVDCVVTSPPYWGLRDYGTATWSGGDAECDHADAKRPIGNSPSLKSTLTTNNGKGPKAGDKFSAGSQFGYDRACSCGAVRIDSQLGLERTPEEYVANMVAVFAEVRRVLKPSGTCWLNLGDSYAASHGLLGVGGRRDTSAIQANNVGSTSWGDVELTENGSPTPHRRVEYGGGIKPKDLVGIPWRVAFALQADGWYLRSDIIWSKPNPMPESVTDRPTKAHEYLFLLTKSARYYFDADAVREEYSPNTESFNRMKAKWPTEKTEQTVTSRSKADPKNPAEGTVNRGNGGLYLDGGARMNPAGRNIRSVWNIATRPYPGAHFAVFPPELPERCIKAGSPDGGLVLDPFAGSGTVGMVANRLSRRAILIDLNPEYLKQQMKRNAQTPLGLPA